MTLKLIISGLIGGVIALIFRFTYDKYNEYRERKHFRQALEINIIKIIIPKLKKLLEEYNKVLNIVGSKDQEEMKENQKITTDEMPMLNSFVFRSIPQKEILKSLNDKSNYGELIDAYYSIDFLKGHMPSNILKEFYQKIEEHMEMKKIDTSEAYYDHLFNCTYLDIIKEHIGRNIELKIETTTELIDQFSGLRKL